MKNILHILLIIFFTQSVNVLKITKITYITIQQLAIVLIIALLEHFNLEVNEKAIQNGKYYY